MLDFRFKMPSYLFFAVLRLFCEQEALKMVEDCVKNPFLPIFCRFKDSRKKQVFKMAGRASTRRLAAKAIVPSEDPKSVFVVIRMEREGGESRVSVRGVHPTEEQAYSAAIADCICALEEESGSMNPKVREIGKTETLSLKQRLKSVQSCQDPDSSGERVEFLVKKSVAFHELKELESEEFLSKPLLPCSYWDSSDEESYDPEEDDEEDEEEEDEDDEDEDMADLVNEDDDLQGIEGSGTKHVDEEEKK